MKACASCPNRLMARLFESLGDEDVAREIRETGCGWWWRVESKDDTTKQIKVSEVCGREALPNWLEHYAHENTLAAKTVQADRNEQKKALDAVETAAREMGLEPIMEHLAQLGLRAAVGHRIEEQRREIAAGEGDPE